MTTLGPATDYTSSSPMVNQGQKKTFITNLRALIADRLGIGYNLAPENVASATNVDLSGLNTRQMNLTGTTQVDTVTAPIGLSVVAKATGAIVLKAAVTGTGADITLAAGDTWTWRATAANTMEVIGLVRFAAASTTTPGIVELATTSETATGADTSRAVTPAGLANSSRIALATAVAPTAVTFVDFTGIPSFAKRITVMFAGLSLSGAALPLIQIGPSGGVETSAYKSICTAIGGSAQSATNGFVIGIPGGAGGNTHHGTYVLSQVTGDTFVGSGVLGILDANTTDVLGGGSKTLAETLTQLRITTTNGTDTFDAGTVNISWE